MHSLPSQGISDICCSQNGILESWSLISVYVFRLFLGLVSFMICDLWIRGDLEVSCQGLTGAPSRNLLCRDYWSNEEPHVGFSVSVPKFKLNIPHWATPQHQPARSLISESFVETLCSLTAASISFVRVLFAYLSKPLDQNGNKEVVDTGLGDGSRSTFVQ
jgi:hypothetical protein